jgi:hypothetical protein
MVLPTTKVVVAERPAIGESVSAALARLGL